ncbi:hypothetical protein NPIL_499621 [Nephila pilipes]|uniref:Uncharacterized protein n=1 Tax=Nephila pilipes TaxID=299642 RepID=A0A8X6QDF7_NEPPI|nr:hypothetical protein NPIL_499621 [Nephila pilipes]
MSSCTEGIEFNETCSSLPSRKTDQVASPSLQEESATRDGTQQITGKNRHFSGQKQTEKAKETREPQGTRFHQQASQAEDRFSEAREGERGEAPRRPERPSTISRAFVRAHENTRKYIKQP